MRILMAPVLAVLWEYTLVLTYGLGPICSALLATLVLGTALGAYVVFRLWRLGYV